ncbi:MAG: LytR C-terminal domain-containing protein [Solirubrobacteraceae bacterium]
MANLPLALSVHHFIDSVGADAGFAAIIGLAILVLLYFAQARETANLREQAYEAAQRVAQLEARLTSLARQQASAAQAVPAARAGAVRAPAPAPAPAFAGAVAMAPGPPAGVAAPALSAATRLIPATPVAEPEPAVPQQDAPEPDGQPVDDTALGSLPPATAAAAGGNGSSHGGVTSPPRVTPPPRGVLPPARGGPPAQAARRPGPASAAAGRRPVAPPPRFSEPPRKRLGLRIVLALAGALVIAAIVVALLHFTGSGSSPNSTRASATSNAPGTTTAARRKRTVTVVPSTVTVSVLNGTASNGLAGRISNQLTSAGYKQGRVATASDQTRTATIVAYMPGHKPDALAVAKSLKLGPASVQPVDQATQAVACPVSTECTSQVVVTVGTDLAA